MNWKCDSNSLVTEVTEVGSVCCAELSKGELVLPKFWAVWRSFSLRRTRRPAILQPTLNQKEVEGVGLLGGQGGGEKEDGKFCQFCQFCRINNPMKLGTAPTLLPQAADNTSTNHILYSPGTAMLLSGLSPPLGSSSLLSQFGFLLATLTGLLRFIYHPGSNFEAHLVINSPVSLKLALSP